MCRTLLYFTQTLKPNPTNLSNLSLSQVKAEEVKEIADEAKADLALAMPAMEAAQNALKALNKADINELKAFVKPPTLVRFVMEPVCILLGGK